MTNVIRYGGWYDEVHMSKRDGRFVRLTDYEKLLAKKRKLERQLRKQRKRNAAIASRLKVELENTNETP